MVAKLVLDQLEKTGGTLTPLTLPSTNATTGQYLKNDGSGGLGWVDAPVVAGFHNVKFITSSTNPVGLTSGTTLIVVEVQGAGGCSGGSDGSAYYGGTGGSGGYSMMQLSVADTSTFNVVVGAGGVDGTAQRDGTDSQFIQVIGSELGSTITAGGGGGTADPPGSHGDGGTGGTVTNTNTPVENRINITGSNGVRGGPGGQAGRDSHWGLGGSRASSTNGAGVAGTGYGSSGSDPMGASQLGGAGAPGLVVIWEYK